MSAVRIARRHRFSYLSPHGQNFSPHGPTHNYEIEAYIEGELNRHGMVMNVRDLDTLLGETTKTCTEKESLAPISSAEFAQTLFNRLQPCVSQHNARLIKLRLYENPDLWFDVCP